MDVQADLGLCWSQRSHCRFSFVLADTRLSVWYQQNVSFYPLLFLDSISVTVSPRLFIIFWLVCLISSFRRRYVTVSFPGYLNYSWLNDFNDSLGPLWYIWKWSSAYVYARGCKQCCNLHYRLWRVSINRDSHFLICSVFFVSKGNLFDVYFCPCRSTCVPLERREYFSVLKNSNWHHCSGIKRFLILAKQSRGTVKRNNSF